MSILQSAPTESRGTLRVEGLSTLASVLVIDDEEIDRLALAQALREEGYEVATAASGQEGANCCAAGNSKWPSPTS